MKGRFKQTQERLACEGFRQFRLSSSIQTLAGTSRIRVFRLAGRSVSFLAPRREPAILRAPFPRTMSATPDSAPNYKNTVLLPKTDFPMKADLVTREPARLQKWETSKLYEKIIEKRKTA